MNLAPSMFTPSEACAIPDGWSPSLNDEKKEEEEVSEILEVEPSPVPRAVEEPPSKRVKITDGLAAMPPRFKAKRIGMSVELHTYAKFENDQAYAILNFIERTDGSDIVEGFIDAAKNESHEILGKGVGSVQGTNKDGEVAEPVIGAESNKLEIVTVKQSATVAVKETECVKNVEQVPIPTATFSLGSAPGGEIKKAGKSDKKKRDDTSLKGRSVNAKAKQPNTDRLNSLRARARSGTVRVAAKMPNAGPTQKLEEKVIEPTRGSAHTGRPMIKLRKSSRAPKPSARATDTSTQEAFSIIVQGLPKAPTLPASPQWRRVMVLPEQ